MKNKKLSSASSQPEKLVRRSAADIQLYVESPQFQADSARLAAIKDEDIDYSDIPSATEVNLAHFRPVKHSVTVRLDRDIIAWLKSKGGHYQTTLNAELRKAMNRESNQFRDNIVR